MKVQQLVETGMFICLYEFSNEEFELLSGPTYILPTMYAIRRRSNILISNYDNLEMRNNSKPLSKWDLGSIYELKFL